LIFTDIVMPGGMTAYDLPQAALETRPRSPLHIRLRGPCDRSSRPQERRVAQEAPFGRRAGREDSPGSARPTGV